MMIGKRLKFWRGWIIGMTGGAIALGLIGLGISRLTTPQQAQLEQTKSNTTQSPQRVEVVALGRLEPQGEMLRVGGPSGERIGRLEVSQGDLVKPGTVLAYLESYEERQAERNYAASQLAEAKARWQAATTYALAQIQEAQTRVEQIDEPRTFELEAQRATIRRIKADLAQAQEDLRRSQTLRQEGAISQQSLDREVSRTQQLQEQLNNAQASLSKLETGLQTNLDNALAQLKSQRANLAVTQTQVEMKSAQQNLYLAEARLERTIIRAPREGRILRILTYPGEAIGQGARSGSGNNGILEMGDTRQMYAVAEVYESDVRLVKLGQPVTVISRNGTFSQPLTGKVAEIGWQIFKNNILDDDPAANADARVVEVKVRLDDSKPVQALTNLQVDVKINVK